MNCKKYCIFERRSFGPFLYYYFESRYDTNNMDIKEYVYRIIDRIQNETIQHDDYCIKYKNYPIILQWEGHSVTIIGVEWYRGEYYILVLDPLKNGTIYKRCIMKYNYSKMRNDLPACL